LTVPADQPSGNHDFRTSLQESRTQFELRLIDVETPDGEVRLADLAALAEGLQELTLRIGREISSHAGPGRTNHAIESLTEMRLSGLSKGSTRLHLAHGRSDELNVDLAEASEINARFWQVVDGIATNSRSPWVTDVVADSAGKVVAALRASAREVELARPGWAPVRLRTQFLRRETWTSARDSVEAGVVAVTGRLEAVDLRNGRFRICDDVGHRIPLDDVPNASTVAHLINHRVRAVGPGVLGSDGQLKGVAAPSVEAQALPGAWSPGRSMDWASELTKPGPVLGGGVELSDEEFAEFIATMKG